MMRMSCAIRNGPKKPCAPNSTTNTNPLMIGEMVNGRSMSVSSRVLPKKSNFAIAHEAASPNSVLSGTLTAAAISVSLIAARVAGSVMARK